MTVLSHVVRAHIRCDLCQSAYIHAEGDVTTFLLDHGWRIDYEQHICPRCARKAS